MATSGFKINGADITASWPDKSYLMDRYPELADTFKQAGLWTWGRDTPYGELGDSNAANKSSPVQTAAGGTNWKQLHTGLSFNAAIKTDGTLWLWGKNDYGQIGDNGTTIVYSPKQVDGGGTNWKQVSCGTLHTTAIKTDGTLWTWGRNGYQGVLGTNTTTNRGIPGQTVSAGTNWKFVSAGDKHTAAIKTDGTLWLWGMNLYGNLGDNTTTDKSSPVQTVSVGTNWKLSSCGSYHTAAIKTDGTLWLWGKNSYGELGTNNTTRVSSPVQTISGGTNWKQVACSARHTAAIKTDGTLWSWGINTYGNLGDNTTTNKSSPVQTVSVGTNWKLVSTGLYNSIAIKTDGTLWVWGQNTDGKLGTNNTTDYSSPVQTVAGGTNWKNVSAGRYHTAAIRDDSSDPI